ncbi:EndoU domain-containing protein [Priestia koreensis]|uniref:EndoU domain-containing protein n=1 Tax=Priestia koreensis TaxID=284581 RepID=UPI00301A0A95
MFVWSYTNILFYRASLNSQQARAFTEQERGINTLSKQYREDVSAELYHSTLMLMSRSNGSQRPITGRTVEHVFHGQVNRRGRAVGYHHESMMGGGEVLSITHPQNARGIYQAEIAVNSLRKRFDSTFFPKDWGQVQVLNVINEAYENKRMIRNRHGDIFYIGTTYDGLKIKMYLDEGEKISTAFPLIERGGR